MSFLHRRHYIFNFAEVKSSQRPQKTTTEFSGGDRIRFEPEVQNSVSVTQFTAKTTQVIQVPSSSGVESPLEADSIRIRHETLLSSNPRFTYWGDHEELLHFDTAGCEDASVHGSANDFNAVFLRLTIMLVSIYERVRAVIPLGNAASE